MIAAEVEVRAGDLLQEGVDCLERGESLKALSCFEKSFRLRQDPRCKSYVGLMIALERGQIREGISLCEESVVEAPDAPVCHLNLGKVLLRAGRKLEAIEAVREGLRVCGEDQAASAAADAFLNSLGTRRKPPLPFLPRNNFINKSLGIFLGWLGLR
jgi:tetratricopeptide (TPR) repeat protein